MITHVSSLPMTLTAPVIFHERTEEGVPESHVITVNSTTPSTITQAFKDHVGEQTAEPQVEGPPQPPAPLGARQVTAGCDWKSCKALALLFSIVIVGGLLAVTFFPTCAGENNYSVGENFRHHNCTFDK